MTCILGIETGRGACSAALYVNGTLHEDTHFPNRGESAPNSGNSPSGPPPKRLDQSAAGVSGRRETAARRQDSPGERPRVGLHGQLAANRAPAHNEQILGLVDAVFAAAGRSSQQLDAAAFGCGPGSFTGIRLAASVAQAVALAAGAQVVPISSTLALAVGAIEKLHLDQGVVVGIRSRREAFYLASFATGDGRPRPRQPDQLLDACPDWAAFSDGWPLVGDRPPWLPAAAAHFELTVGAGLIARLGAAAFAAGRGLVPELGLPTYVNGDTPWRPAVCKRHDEG